MKKYYIDKVPFAYDNTKKWGMIILYIENCADNIEVVEELIGNSDKADRKIIQDLLNREVDYFKNQKPFDKTVSLSPFLLKNDYNSVCFKYKITKEIINELKTDWLKDLEFEHVISPLIAYNKNTPILWINFYGTVVLLGAGELNSWKNIGFDLVEYNILLNETIYKINQ